MQDDIVFVHVATEGEIDGRLQRREFVRGYRPVKVAGTRQTAIAWTTTGSVVAVMEMVRDAILPNRGFLRQEDISLKALLATKTGALYN